jgi:rhodanese-related sulfurtransferase
MSLQTIDAATARRLVAEGAVLVDVRESDERAREHIPGTRHAPALKPVEAPGAKAVIFHCRSGARTGANAGRLAEAAGCEAYLLEGGLDAWKRAGLPVSTDRKQPIEIMRQVQIVAGSLSCWGSWSRHPSSRFRRSSARASSSPAAPDGAAWPSCWP